MPGTCCAASDNIHTVSRRWPGVRWRPRRRVRRPRPGRAGTPTSRRPATSGGRRRRGRPAASSAIARGVVAAVHPVQLGGDVQAQHDAGQVGVSGWYRVGLGRRGTRLQPPRAVDQQASGRLLPLTRRAGVEVGQSGGAGQAEGGEEVGEHADRDLAVLAHPHRLTAPRDQVGGHVTGQDRVSGDELGGGTGVPRPLLRVLPEQAGARVRRDAGAQPGPAALRPGVLVGRISRRPALSNR